MNNSEVFEQYREEYQNLLGEMKSIDPRAWVGLLCIAASIAFGIYLSKKRNSRRAERFARAKEAGHVIEATCVKRRRDDDGNYSRYSSKYVYTINGKQKYYHATDHYLMPDTINLYYDEDPDKVYSKYDGDIKGFLLFLPYFLIVPMGTCWLAMTLLGYRW